MIKILTVVLFLFLLKDSFQSESNNDNVATMNAISKRYFEYSWIKQLMGENQRQTRIEKIRKMISEKKKLKNYYELKKMCKHAGINFESYLKMRNKLIKKFETNPEKYEKLIQKIN